MFGENEITEMYEYRTKGNEKKCCCFKKKNVKVKRVITKFLIEEDERST